MCCATRRSRSTRLRGQHDPYRHEAIILIIINETTQLPVGMSHSRLSAFWLPCCVLCPRPRTTNSPCGMQTRVPITKRSELLPMHKQHPVICLSRVLRIFMSRGLAPLFRYIGLYSPGSRFASYIAQRRAMVKVFHGMEFSARAYICCVTTHDLEYVQRA